jgi:hypothetical protein
VSRALCLVAALGLALALAGPARADKNDWEVQGVMSDACQCIVFCPCEFQSTPSFNHCEDALVLHIQKGHYGDVKLDGLRICVVSQSPEGQRMADATGNFKFAHLYVPETVTDAQAKALAEVARRAFGTQVKEASRISPDETVEKVRMDVMLQPNHHKVTIPGILELDLETVPGGDGKTPMVIHNSPYAALGFGDIQVAQSNVYKYTQGDIAWDYSGRSASIRTFKLQGRIASK